MLHRYFVLSLTFLGLILTLGGTTVVAEDPDQGATVAATEPIQAEKPVYGPILSKDPLVRAEIKRLYIELNEIDEETQVQLTELSERMSTETDPDFRYEIQVNVAQLKENHLLRSMELNLDIARLNEDGSRVADFGHALDQLLNPEKYRSEIPADELP